MTEDKAIISQCKMWLSEMDYRFKGMQNKENLGTYWPQWAKELRDILDGKWIIPKDTGVNKKLY